MKHHKIFHFSSVLLLLTIWGCKQESKNTRPIPDSQLQTNIRYAKGFEITKSDQITIISVSSPWPDSEAAFKYALIPKESNAKIDLDEGSYDAIIPIPAERIVVTSTTHIPALESLGVEESLVGFPSTQFVSSEATRKRIAKGEIQELGTNESINTEILINLNPDLVVGFGISGKNKAYETLQSTSIPLVYNGDWVEETPLGKAEWIKFFAPFFGMEEKADSIFRNIEETYNRSKILAREADKQPTVLTGGLYKDVWYVAGGKSWMAQFLRDANTNYLWKETANTGSISLSLESVLEKAQAADFWLNPSLHTTYLELEEANRHYLQFDAFKNKTVFTHAATQGETGGLLFYEFAPNRPDLVLQDLIHIFHPELLPNYQPFFFKPLK